MSFSKLNSHSSSQRGESHTSCSLVKSSLMSVGAHWEKKKEVGEVKETRSSVEEANRENFFRAESPGPEPLSLWAKATELFFFFFFLQTGKKWIGALISRNLCEILTATLWKWKARWVETWKPCLVVVWVDRILGGIKIIIIMINVHMAVPSRSRSWSDGVQPTPHNYFRFSPVSCAGKVAGSGCFSHLQWLFASYFLSRFCWFDSFFPDAAVGGWWRGAG